METSEALLLVLTVVGVLALVGGLMVSMCCLSSEPSLTCIQIGAAFLLGSRFDKTFADLDAKMMGQKSSASSVPTLAHEEL